MSRYTAVAGLLICVLHGEEVLHQLMLWQELFVMIAAGAVDPGASFRRVTTGQNVPVVTGRKRPIAASHFSSNRR